LPTLVTKNEMLACCACAGAVKPSPVNATAAKSGSLTASVMKNLPIRLNALDQSRPRQMQGHDPFSTHASVEPAGLL
jgi:hypothetical protein